MFEIEKHKGFTLIEVILTLAIIGIVIQLSYSLLFSGTKSFQVGRDKGLSQQDFRIVQEILKKEIRYVKYLNNIAPEDDVNETYEKYYSLELKENDDESYSFIRKEYVKDELEANLYQEDTAKEIQLVARIYKGQLPITIKIPEEGLNVVDISLGKNGEKSFSISLENISESNEKFELILNDSENNRLYYAYPYDMK